MNSDKSLKRINVILEIFLITVITAVVIFFVGLTAAKSVYKVKYSEYIEEYCKAYGLKESTVLAVIKAESNFKVKAVSKNGAKGLMQITDGTAEFIADKLGEENYDIFDPQTNIRFGCWFLSYLSLAYDGDTVLIHSAYNAGKGNVDKWLADEKYSKDGKLQVIPFKETSAYLTKIKRNIKMYKRLYNL